MLNIFLLLVPVLFYSQSNMQLKISKAKLDSAKYISDLIPAVKKGCTISSYEVIGVNNGRTLVHVGKSDTLDGSALVLLKNADIKSKVFIDLVLQCSKTRSPESYKLAVTP